ncbi:Polyadenylate-binding protein-interacting protein 1-like Protein [Tribolium castaneum]|uniref:Polyadenylate-binding protein-interacting protein 1-like Protein n=1 Tax=Tribolium castaneum TaxID=7070 RepID=D6WED2_TRICA|nr:Polyadenylate-binding protein-interacting protein 1-like Protein [Tribolium castaneum]
MDDNKAPALWDAKCEAPKGLRPPNAPPTRLLEDTKTSEKPFKSSLSADAPEFIPASMKSSVTTQSSGVQDRLKKYTAARLCCFIEQCCPEFRAELHLTCQKQLKVHTNKSGLLLFVAELYTQLHHENIYGGYLIDAYKHLLAVGGNDNVKSICQALKLTGYSLELYDKKALDEVFEKLNEVKPTVTGTALSLINSVVNLRSSQWGHNSPTNSSSNSEPENTYWSDTSHTVFYSSDGSKFTSEENDFLAANMNSTEEYLTDLSDPDELCDPEPEMDEEIQAAFKDFVKLSKR